MDTAGGLIRPAGALGRRITLAVGSRWLSVDWRMVPERVCWIVFVDDNHQ